MLAPKAQEHKFWPEKVFSTNNSPPPPHLSSQNDQRDVGIILSHRCWVDPPPPARQVGHPRPELPPPVTAAKEGGGGGWENGLPCHPPPPQSNFLPALSNVRCHEAVGRLPPPQASLQTDQTNPSLPTQVPLPTPLLRTLQVQHCAKGQTASRLWLWTWGARARPSGSRCRPGPRPHSMNVFTTDTHVCVFGVVPVVH